MSSTDFNSLAIDGQGQGANGAGNGWYGSLYGGDPDTSGSMNSGLGSGTMQGAPVTAGPISLGMAGAGGAGGGAPGAGGSQMGGIKPFLSQLFGLPQRNPMPGHQPQRPIMRRPQPRPVPNRPIARPPMRPITRQPIGQPIAGGTMQGAPARFPGNNPNAGGVGRPPMRPIVR